MIVNRIRQIAGLSEKVEFLTKKEAAAEIRSIGIYVRNSQENFHRKLDESKVAPGEARKWLLDLPVSDRCVYVYWAWDHQGVKMPYEEFVRYYDGLWFPSSDDLFVVPANKSWIIEIDHEEIFVFRWWRLPSV